MKLDIICAVAPFNKKGSLSVECYHFKISLMCFTREKACSLQKQLWDLKILPFSQTPAVFY